MADATWVRNYNQKWLYWDTNSGDNTEAIRMDAESATQDHGLLPENDNWDYVGINTRRFWVMYAASGFGTSSLKFKTDVKYLNHAELDNVLASVNKIESIRYKWNKSVWEKDNGNFADNGLHQPGEKPDPNQVVREWMGFSAESLPSDCVDETGENFQYGAMIGLLVASTKALTRRTEVLADALNIDLNNLPEGGVINKNISDFGTGNLNGKEMWVAFADDFVTQLGGKTPVITVTSDDPEVTLSVKGKTSKGFNLVSLSGKTVNFDYIAMSKIKLELLEETPEQKEKQGQVFKADINQWRADQLAKMKNVSPQVGHPAEEALEKQKSPIGNETKAMDGNTLMENAKQQIKSGNIRETAPAKESIEQKQAAPRN